MSGCDLLNKKPAITFRPSQGLFGSVVLDSVGHQLRHPCDHVKYKMFDLLSSELSRPMPWHWVLDPCSPSRHGKRAGVDLQSCT